MHKIISVAAALLLLAVLHFTGLISVSNLSHPFWHATATLVGATIGLAIIFFVFWMTERRVHLARAVVIAIAVAFSISVFVTWISARIFIGSADFEWLPGQVWHKGYQISVALFVPLVALIVLRFLRRS